MAAYPLHDAMVIHKKMQIYSNSVTINKTATHVLRTRLFRASFANEYQMQIASTNWRTMNNYGLI